MTSARDWQRVLDSVRDVQDPRTVQRRLTWWRVWFEVRLILRVMALSLVLTIPAVALVLAVTWLVGR